MSPIRIFAALALLGASAAAAAATSDFVLFEKLVKFKVPSDWNVIMEKKDGNPQFMAFQVRDPADPENNEIAQVTVNAKLMHDSTFFQQQVDAATDKAKQLPGFEQVSDGVEPTVLRYFAMNGNTKYEYRETFYLVTHLFLHIRCSRPMLKDTTQAWVDAYVKGCGDLMTSLKPK
jgi:hypothetical protein